LGFAGVFLGRFAVTFFFPLLGFVLVFFFAMFVALRDTFGLESGRKGPVKPYQV
jgi:hypothetical protein